MVSFSVTAPTFLLATLALFVTKEDFCRTLDEAVSRVDADASDGEDKRAFVFFKSARNFRLAGALIADLVFEAQRGFTFRSNSVDFGNETAFDNCVDEVIMDSIESDCLGDVFLLTQFVTNQNFLNEAIENHVKEHNGYHRDLW